MDDCPVDRCVCHNVSFAELVRIGRTSGAGLEELQRRTGAGTGCGLCLPYIRAALATGRGSFPVMSVEALRLLASANKGGGGQSPRPRES